MFEVFASDEKNWACAFEVFASDEKNRACGFAVFASDEKNWACAFGVYAPNEKNSACAFEVFAPNEKVANVRCAAYAAGIGAHNRGVLAKPIAAPHVAPFGRTALVCPCTITKIEKKQKSRKCPSLVRMIKQKV